MHVAQTETPQLTLRRDGRPTRKQVGGPVVLNARMVRMISLMVDGHPDDPSRTPYGLYDAAAVVGYRRKAARELAKSPIFVEAHNAAFAAAIANLPAPNLCPSIEVVREREAARAERKQMQARLRETDKECKRLPDELVAMKERAPQRTAFAPQMGVGYVVRLQQVETEGAAND